MSFSWGNLTRRVWFQNYRDWTAMTMITSYVVAQGMAAWANKKE